ncbi:MAG TPA: phage terminase large subunit [Mycobacteriales bacterium]|nr:phage terminase large subunit [Mycobacteriales bacterium]
MTLAIAPGQLDPFAVAAKRFALPVTRWTPRPHQLPPTGPWHYWLLMAGRGAGKTDAAAHWLDAHMEGPACIAGASGGHRAAIISTTLQDARETCVDGVSGLKVANPRVRFNSNRGVVTWPNGAEGRIFGAYLPEDPERLRGPQHCVVWGDEIAAWRQLDDTFAMMEFGLRLGSHPVAIFTTTPKPRPKIRALVADPGTAVTHATTDDNPFLHEDVRALLYAKYKGTRTGRQELAGELLVDVPGALWQYEWIERNRVMPDPKREYARIVVAIDPAATADEESDESAIAVAAKGKDGQLYVLAADGYHLSPNGWATKAVDAYDTHKADAILAEVNNGGDMVVSTVQKVRPGLPVRKITASRGKTLRAEPISLLYEQNRVHHIGTFEALEDQQTTFPVANEHDDRLDAVVYALTELTEGGSGWGDYMRQELDRMAAEKAEKAAA